MGRCLIVRDDVDAPHAWQSTHDKINEEHLAFSTRCPLIFITSVCH